MQKYKIIIIGPERSGKSLIADYLYDSNREQPKIYRPTIGVRILEIQRTLMIDNKEQDIQVELWDLSGNIQYEQIWITVQNNVDGVVIVSNGDNMSQQDQIEGWINNFPKKLKMSPSYCLGLLNHPCGQIRNEQQIKIAQVQFNHCCFEQRGTTISPQFDKFLGKLVKIKQEKEEVNQQQII